MIMKHTKLEFEAGSAICYSGYREGQSPQTRSYPSYQQIREDLLILAKNWRYLRLYDCSLHAERVLLVIRNEGLALRVMLGVDIAAESSNPQCPWGAEFSDAILIANRAANEDQISRLSTLSREFDDIVFAVSIGNEASVEWTDHLVPVERLVAYAREIKSTVSQPVTFCENYVPWTNKLEPLAAELDFLSIHTYPVWEYRSIDDALAYTVENYQSVANHYPDKTIVITEAGWPTRSNGRGIEPANASETLQTIYYQQLVKWARQEDILTFVFEAFDEPWKGSADPSEPEKHWGLFNVDRSPKAVMQSLYRALVRAS